MYIKNIEDNSRVIDILGMLPPCELGKMVIAVVCWILDNGCIYGCIQVLVGRVGT